MALSLSAPANRFIFSIIVCIWVIGVINFLLGYKLNQLGIYPRELIGLRGVVLSPFLHGGFGHLTGNTLTFACLGWLSSLVFPANSKGLIPVCVFVAIVGGALTWIFARQAFHVGLSGVIFGLWGFVTVNGFFNRSFKSIAISLVAILFYGGMFFGVLPSDKSISFEGHLFGAFAGALYSYLYMRKKKS